MEKRPATQLPVEAEKSGTCRHMVARGLLHDTTNSPPSTSTANYYSTAFETGGRFGTGVLRLLRTLALRRQITLGLTHDRLLPAGRFLLQSWTQRLSVTLHLTTVTTTYDGFARFETAGVRPTQN